MSWETIKKIDAIYWWHVGWKALAGTAVIVATGSPTIIMHWEGLTDTQKLKIVAIIGLLGTVLKSLDMLFDTTLSRIAAGKLPVKLDGINGGSGDTQHIQKPQ